MKIKKGAMAKGKQPLFVSCVLQNIWNLAAAVTDKNTAKIQKMSGAIGIKVTPRDLQQTDSRVSTYCISAC